MLSTLKSLSGPPEQSLGFSGLSAFCTPAGHITLCLPILDAHGTSSRSHSFVCASLGASPKSQEIIWVHGTHILVMFAVGKKTRVQVPRTHISGTEQHKCNPSTTMARWEVETRDSLNKRPCLKDRRQVLHARLSSEPLIMALVGLDNSHIPESFPSLQSEPSGL